MYTEDDADALRAVANVMRASGCEVPQWMLELKKHKSRDRRKAAQLVVKKAVSEVANGNHKRKPKSVNAGADN